MESKLLKEFVETDKELIESRIVKGREKDGVFQSAGEMVIGRITSIFQFVSSTGLDRMSKLHLVNDWRCIQFRSLV